jgi:hypothetical protein
VSDTIIKTVTTCPTCGVQCRIGGDDKEGTHYYVPIVNAALLEAAKKMVKHPTQPNIVRLRNAIAKAESRGREPGKF